MWELVVVAALLLGMTIGAVWLMSRVLVAVVQSASEVFREVLSPPEVEQGPEPESVEMFLPPWERLPDE